jgi:microcin C transport system permease protein
VLHTYPETTFGGDFPTPADYHDPFIRKQLSAPGNFAVYAPVPWSPDEIDLFAQRPFPSSPSARHWLGTDDRGRDVLARLVYGFRLSVLFALALTAIGTVLGLLIGAVQFAPSFTLLLVLLSLFGWMGLADYVRAEFLRNRQMDYVRAAQALGLSHARIMWRHVLPNSLTPVITFLPFRMSAAVLALASLDFLGLGVPPPTPSLGELLAQAKANLDAWWLAAAAFGALVSILLLLTFIGQALRDALDPRHTVTPLAGEAVATGSAA